MAHILSPYDVTASRPGQVRNDLVRTEPLPPLRLVRAKKAYTTRFLASRLDHSPEGFYLQDGASIAPDSGDIVLARIVKLGQHPRLESPSSRRQALFVGDEILVPYGHRYAPDQFLAQVPSGLGQCHLVAAGGVAGLVTAQHSLMSQPTLLAPVGLLADDAGVVNLRSLAPHQPDITTTNMALKAISARDVAVHRPPVIAVLGTSMNSGKSTVLSCLVRGLSLAGLRVSAGKATGTGAGNDPGMYVDAGAVKVLDFTDFGFPTTFRLDDNSIQAVFTGLVAALIDSTTDVVLVEIADGVYQGETRRLLSSPIFQAVVDRAIFTATDSLGASAGLQVLRSANIPVAAVSGVLTSSPLAVQEASEAIDVPVLTSVSLCEPEVAVALLPRGAEEPAPVPK
ncbi:DUF1611 domain-containing protein [Arthrobacter sp. UYEF20]|uniref:DUF1611 domain-containing protein n=1 Tax=Arthrobacter sp. UYEF20 TaxID=1756363 RepID=UPI003391D14A